jgi:hypothetical protein
VLLDQRPRQSDRQGRLALRRVARFIAPAHVDAAGSRRARPGQARDPSVQPREESPNARTEAQREEGREEKGSEEEGGGEEERDEDREEDGRQEDGAQAERQEGGGQESGREADREDARAGARDGGRAPSIGDRLDPDAVGKVYVWKLGDVDRHARPHEEPRESHLPDGTIHGGVPPHRDVDAERTTSFAERLLGGRERGDGIRRLRDHEH